MSAWIEIQVPLGTINSTVVALLVSAWIEIWKTSGFVPVEQVALLVSAWIEMFFTNAELEKQLGRTPRECVY